MGKSKRPRKAYRPRQASAGIAGRLQPWALDRVLAPLENMLRHIRRGGELDVDESDTLIYACSATGSHYDVIGLVQAFAETFAKQRQCDPKAPAVDRLHELIASINGDTVTEAMVDAGLACVASIRAYMAANPLGNIREAALSVSRAA